MIVRDRMIDNHVWVLMCPSISDFFISTPRRRLDRFSLIVQETFKKTQFNIYTEYITYFITSTSALKFLLKDS